MTAYDRDFHGWANAQAAALRARSANQIDWENVAEEIESLGKQQIAELRRRLELLILHLLKWSHQPDRQGRSWSNTIREQRRRLRGHIAENPSLKAVQDQTFQDAYQDARYSASKEMTGEPEPEMFPAEPPFTADQALTDGWLPDAVTPEQSPG